MSGDRPWLHFAHANGYPPGCYRSVLTPLQDSHEVFAFPLRPLQSGASPASLSAWRELAGDLIGMLDRQGLRGGVGVGHSLGGVVTLLAARQRPDLFTHLVLVEPVFLPASWYALAAWLPVSWRARWFPLSRQALRRRHEWPDQDRAYRHLRAKSVFRRIPDAVFSEMMDAMLIPAAAGGVTLAYSREWESRIYSTPDNPYPALRRCTVPTLVLRGEHTDTIRGDAWMKARQMHPAAVFEEVPDAGHLLPLEQADWVARRIQAFVR